MQKKERKLGQIIYRWLIVLVLGVFVLAALAGYFVQNYFQERQSFTLLREYIDNFEANWDFNADMKEYITYNWGMDNDTEEGSFDHFQDNDFLRRLAESNSYWLTEVSIVDNRGILSYSSNAR